MSTVHPKGTLKRRQSHYSDILLDQRAATRGTRKLPGMSYQRHARTTLKDLRVDTFKVLVSWSWFSVLAAFLAVLAVLAAVAALCLLPLYHGGAVRMEGAGHHFLGLFAMALSNLVALGCEWGVPVTRGAQLFVAALNFTGVVATSSLIGVIVTKFSHKPHGLVFSEQLLAGTHIGGAACLRLRVANASGGNVLQPVLKMTVLVESAQYRATKAADPAAFVGLRKVVIIAPVASVSDFAYMPPVLYIDHVCSGDSPFVPREQQSRACGPGGGGAPAAAVAAGATAPSAAAPLRLAYCVDDFVVLMVSLMGTDSVSGLPVFGTKAYTKESLKEGFAFVDCMLADGAIDMQLFDKVERVGAFEEKA
jgi:hypothetical protein